MARCNIGQKSAIRAVTNLNEFVVGCLYKYYKMYTASDCTVRSFAEWYLKGNYYLSRIKETRENKQRVIFRLLVTLNTTTNKYRILSVFRILFEVQKAIKSR